MANRKKAKPLPDEEVLQVAGQIHLGMRHLLQVGGDDALAILNTAIDVSRVQGQRRAAISSRGGEATAKANKATAAAWHDECVSRARALLAQGRSPRELASILAKTFGKSPRQVSSVLKKAEVK